MGILDSFKLEGKVALVTGASRGIGSGLAAALAEAGADVVGISRSETAPETQAAVEAAGRRYIHISADLGAPISALPGFVQQAVDTFGGLDILVNNAGAIWRGGAFDMTEADWDHVLHIQLKVSFFLAQAAAREMLKKNYGKIINIASMTSYQGGLRIASYTTAKSGIVGLTRALSTEWAPLGINVNAIAPGYIATDQTAVLQADPERSPAIVERIPVGRWGTPDDLKGAVVFAASAASDYMHGTTIPIDGGWLAR